LKGGDLKAIHLNIKQQVCQLDGFGGGKKCNYFELQEIYIKYLRRQAECIIMGLKKNGSFSRKLKKYVEKFYTRCRDILHLSIKAFGRWRKFREA